MSNQDNKPLLVDSSKAYHIPSDKSSCKTKGVILMIIVFALTIIVYISVSYAMNMWPFKEDTSETHPKYPNVIFILMDDLGITDNPYHSSLFNEDFKRNNKISFAMNNLQNILSNSIRLNYHYTESACSPTRSSLLTGVYSWKTGVFRPIGLYTETHVDTNLTLLSEYLSESNANYDTLIAGKWHIGSSNAAFMPYNRGFNNENNLFLSGAHSDFHMKNNCILLESYDNSAINNNGFQLNESIIEERNALFGDRFCSYDLFDNNGIVYDPNDTYNEELFAKQILKFLNDRSNSDDSNPYFIYYTPPTPHFPVTHPPMYDVYNEVIDYSECNNITSDGYRIQFCKMMIYMDVIISHIIDNVNLNDTIIIFTGDNGGAPAVYLPVIGFDISAGQNLPLRGVKQTVFEGGIRTGAFIYGGFDYLLNDKEYECDYNEIFHVSDWLPTLLDMIGVEYNNNNLDGINLWKDIKQTCDKSEKRTEKKRTEIISIRLCDDGTFAQTFIRKIVNDTSWKLIINGSRIRCGSNGQFMDWSYYLFHDATFTMIPNQIWYNNVVENNNLFKSECYENMNATERNNTNNFLYKEFMLFDIGNDQIEVCNVVDKYPQIVNQLLLHINQQIESGEYNTYSPPSMRASAVLSQMNNESFKCEKNWAYTTLWRDQKQYKNVSWRNWDYVWKRAIQQVKSCHN